MASARSGPGYWVRLVLVNALVLLGLFIITDLVLGVVFSTSSSTDILKFANSNQIERVYPQKYEAHRYLGYWPIPNYSNGKNIHNSLGFRGEEITQPKPSTTYRIVCIGGSTTYTSNIEDYRLSYPYLLQNELTDGGCENCEVINAGAGSWSSWESLVNLQLRVLDLNPDMIIVYHSINDIHPRLVWPPENYKGDNSGRRIASSTKFPSWADFIVEKSNLLRTLAVMTGTKTSNIYLSQIDKYPPTYYFYEFNKQFKEKTYPSGIFDSIPVSRMLEINQPKYFQRNLECMINVCKAKNIDVVLSTFAVSSEFPDEFISTKEYVGAFVENNQLIKNISDSQEVKCFDFAAVFPTDKSFYVDGRHVNEEGARLKAKMFSTYLLPYLNQKPPNLVNVEK